CKSSPPSSKHLRGQIGRLDPLPAPRQRLHSTEALPPRTPAGGCPSGVAAPTTCRQPASTSGPRPCELASFARGRRLFVLPRSGGPIALQQPAKHLVRCRRAAPQPPARLSLKLHCFVGRTSAGGTPLRVDTLAPAGRLGTVARRPRKRLPTHNADCGPS